MSPATARFTSLGRAVGRAIVSVTLGVAACSPNAQSDASLDSLLHDDAIVASESASGSDALDAPGNSGFDAASDSSFDAPTDAPGDVPVARDTAIPRDAGTDTFVPPPCATRITYGSAWIHPPGHPQSFDDATGAITWDGACATDASGNSVATLSNGWSPTFLGRGSCVINLQLNAGCPGGGAACATRVTYGPAWLAPAGHAARFDDVAGPTTWDGICRVSGAQSFAALSNGWQPHFAGAGGCELSIRYSQCGGLYANPVVATDCPDPGVLHDGNRYVMACTSGNGADAFPMRTSPDLVTWTDAGFIFPAARRPAWAASDFWAPEIHRVGATWVAYFSARNAADGHLSIGAASSPSPLGPFTDIGHPLVHDATFGLIDASEFEAANGTRYVIWKVDGNATGQRTPIRIQPLTPDGLALTGAPTTLISNDQPWEGGVVEGPWMIEYAGAVYLFYSGNGYASTAYALGVARAPSPLGPFVKAPAPIIVSNAAWSGPGHGSVVIGPSGDAAFVYHAWIAGRIGMAPGREVLVDRVYWNAGWPELIEAPSTRSVPLP